MSQRDSGYERKERDLYETPAWVTEALIPHIPGDVLEIWEPACGSGKMVRELERHGFTVHGTDIDQGFDFLTDLPPLSSTIVTNPPYVLAKEFIKLAIERSEFVAMLLRTDFDHAKTRSYLFGDCPSFAKKVVLTKRIQWFEDSKGAPSFNHAWFIWRSDNMGAPTLAYGP